MDSKRAYYWRLLMLFYDNFVLETADFELYPYISTQLVNLLACAITKHAADQHEDYFGHGSSDDIGYGPSISKPNFSNLEPQKELVCLTFCKYMTLELLP